MVDWERRPGRPHGQGDFQDLEEVFRRLKDSFGFGSLHRGPVWMIVIVVVLLLVGFNSYYIVQPQETAVIRRFGKFIGTADAGFHMKIPFGVETVTKVLTGRVLQREYGYRTVQASVRSRFSEKGYEEESTMLSGDLNVVNLQWAVQYKVENPVDFLFRVHQVEETLDDISESVIRRIVGNRYADEVLTVGRASVADMAQKELQAILDQYSTGLKIIAVKLQNVNPPDPVKGAFNEVNEALQEKERMINDAQQAYNQKIPKAAGEARQTITQAEGYALEKVNRAQGDVARFSEILTEYEKAPDVTRRRMYLEAFGDFIGRIDRLFVMDESLHSMLPLFDLNKASKDLQQLKKDSTDTSSAQSREHRSEEGR
ncbi:MAG: FtsH protease activity modulator HflK [Syntrophobacteraceae bacterium]